MEIRSVSRELALLLLGQVSIEEIRKIEDFSIEVMLSKALESLSQYWRDELDLCADNIKRAQEELVENELNYKDSTSIIQVRENLKDCLKKLGSILNSLSESMEFPRLLILSDQKLIRKSALKRVNLVLNKYHQIDNSIDNVMEGWRFKRLPRIDRDILRLALIDMVELKTPVSVTCNEAVNLANRYSDEQGRKMINGVLRRLQSLSPSQFKL